MSEFFSSRTIHIGYNFYNGYWVTPSDSYNGALSAVDRELVYVPENRVRVEVEDCGSGYVCLRTRWNEDDSSSKPYYLQTGYFDVDFETDSVPALNEKLNWHIYCTNETATTDCWICDQYYSQEYPGEYWNCLYGTSASSLKTDWNSDHPAEWFSWNIVWEETENLGYVESTGSACNAAGHPVTVPLDLCTGIEIESSYIWQVTSSIEDEIRTGVREDLVNPGQPALNSAEWASELQNGTSFHPISCSRYNVIVETGSRMALLQLTATYGPYNVRGTSFMLSSSHC